MTDFKGGLNSDCESGLFAFSTNSTQIKDGFSSTTLVTDARSTSEVDPELVARARMNDEPASAPAERDFLIELLHRQSDRRVFAKLAVAPQSFADSFVFLV
jgi:hypothetical protein